MDNQMTNLRCRKCGAAISADQKKCPKCGAPILLKVMMEEEKRHLPAKEIREKDKRMRREYDKMSKEKEIERQKAEKKKQQLEEKAEKKRQKEKNEREAVREKEEKRVNKAQEKIEKQALTETAATDAPEKKSKAGLIWGIIAAILVIGAVVIFALSQQNAELPAVSQEVEEPSEPAEEQEIAEEPAQEEQPQEAEAPAEPEKPQEPEKPAEPEKPQEPEKKPERKITKNNYLFPSDTQQLTEADLNGLSKYDTGLIRNEIYARKGYVFKAEPYKSYFNSQAWYNPNPSAKMKLNETEKYNVNFLLEYERAQGWR